MSLNKENKSDNKNLIANKFNDLKYEYYSILI